VDSVGASTAATPLCDVPRRVTSSLADFAAVTVDEVAKLISSAPSKTRQLDPAPTCLVKDMIGLLSPFIALLINKSLSTGCFSGEFKEAIVRPLLKRDGLDLNDLKNYRPVSKLPFLSKLLERVVQARLQAYLDGSSLLPGWQSVYRRLHSTETAVTKVFNDLLVAVDRVQMSALCLLDLSPAFDTVDHDLQLQQLKRQFGLCGTVLQWIHLYLYGDVLLFVVDVMCSVPQGSVLGPLFFVLYMADFADRAVKYGVSLHAYADDTELYHSIGRIRLPIRLYYKPCVYLVPFSR